jgi:hypothetical protein
MACRRGRADFADCLCVAGTRRVHFQALLFGETPARRDELPIYVIRPMCTSRISQRTRPRNAVVGHRHDAEAGPSDRPIRSCGSAPGGRAKPSSGPAAARWLIRAAVSTAWLLGRQSSSDRVGMQMGLGCRAVLFSARNALARLRGQPVRGPVGSGSGIRPFRPDVGA